MTELANIFTELGLNHYLDDFIEQGFDSWETILDITESDFDALGVKLGHRRKLQRKIANSRGYSSDRALEAQNSPPPDRATVDDQPKLRDDTKESTTNGASTGVAHTSTIGGGPVVPTTKRKYRRHPKPDENAPERPPSAYVIFSNKMREDLKGRNLSFTEIAKLVGENWQNLSPSDKELYEQQAFTAKERYVNELMEYKKTSCYKKYSFYLADFKARHSNQNSGGNQDTDCTKRPKLDSPSANCNSSVVSCATSKPGEISSSGSGSSSGSSCSTNSRLDSVSSASTPSSSSCSWFRTWDVDRSPTRESAKLITVTPSTSQALGPKSPKSRSPSAPNVYRDSSFTNGSGTPSQNYSWKDSPREENSSSTQQSFMRIAGFNENRPTLSEPSAPTGPYKPTMNLCSPMHRRSIDKIEPLNTRPTTSVSGTSSPTFFNPRTALEPPLDRPHPKPLHIDQILDDKYERQLPPIVPLSLSPKSNSRNISNQSQIHHVQPHSPYQSHSQQVLISPNVIDRIMDISSGQMPPMRDYSEHNDYRVRDFMSVKASDNIRLDSVSAILQAGDMVNQNSMERNR